MLGNHYVKESLNGGNQSPKGSSAFVSVTQEIEVMWVLQLTILSWRMMAQNVYFHIEIKIILL